MCVQTIIFIDFIININKCVCIWENVYFTAEISVTTEITIHSINIELKYIKRIVEY